MGKFTYLPYCIVLVCVEYLVAIKLAVLWTTRKDEKRQRSYSSSWRLGPAPQRWFGIFDQRSFYSSCSGMYGRSSSYVLLCTRLASFLFFVVIGMGFNFARDEVQGHWQFFTNWNVGLIAGYYTLTTAASVHYIRLIRSVSSDAERASDSSMLVLLADLDTTRYRIIGTFLSVYCCIASVTAFFVTTVNFVLLDPTPRFYNMTAHLFTSVSFFVELSLNSIEFKKNEIILNISWVMLWLVVIWPVVWLGVKPDWPYDFMDSSTPAVFLWFQILFVVYFIIYYICETLMERKIAKFSKTESYKLSHADYTSNDKPYHALLSEI